MPFLDDGDTRELLARLAKYSVVKCWIGVGILVSIEPVLDIDSNTVCTPRN